MQLPVGRLYLCARCRAQVFICRRSDRGNRYCHDCAAHARRDSVREAGQRYQLSRRGRFAHAARARRYRARRQIVAHHGSPDFPDDAVLQPDRDAAAADELPLINLAVAGGIDRPHNKAICFESIADLRLRKVVNFDYDLSGLPLGTLKLRSPPYTSYGLFFLVSSSESPKPSTSTVTCH